MPPDVPQLPSPAWIASMRSPDQQPVDKPGPVIEGEIIGRSTDPSTGAKPQKRKRAGVDERVRAFVDNLFLHNFNGSQAAIAAGFTKASAGAQASMLLKNPNVQALIAERHRSLADKSSELLKRVREKLEWIAFGDMRDLYHHDGRLKLPTEMTEDQAAMVAGLTYAHKLGMAEGPDGEQVVVMVETVKVKFHDPQKALDMLGRHTGLFSADGNTLAGGRVAAKLVVNFVKPKPVED